MKSSLFWNMVSLSDEIQPTFWRNISPPSSVSAWCLLHAGSMLGLLFNPEDEGVLSSGTLADFHWITQCCIPEDRTIHFKSFMK
jgi:hypothetical protein